MWKDKTSKPTRATMAARPNVVSDDLAAGRAIRHAPSSNSQILTKDDNSHRVSPSAKFYIVQLMGIWLHIDESAERTIRHGTGLRKVRFENKDYELRRATEFQPFVRRFLQFGCYAYIGGVTINSEKEMKKVLPQNFIYVASSKAWDIFETMRKESRKGG